MAFKYDGLSFVKKRSFLREKERFFVKIGVYTEGSNSTLSNRFFKKG